MTVKNIRYLSLNQIILGECSKLESTDQIIKPVPLAEVKNILKKISKDRKEMIYEQKVALEHATKFGKLSIKKTEDMIKELMENKDITEVNAIKIADILPRTEDDIKTIFAKERITISGNDIKQILDIVAKYNIE
jgi:DNA-directed RNA polymerase subunit F